MNRWKQSLNGLTATDVVRRDAASIPQQMSLPAAARVLTRRGDTEALITDTRGRCVGVLRAADFVRAIADGPAAITEHPPGDDCAWTDWQIVGSSRSREDEVLRHTDLRPVTVAEDAHLADILRVMLDTRISRVVVVDARQRPVGIVSSLDVLAILTRAERPGRSSGSPTARAAGSARGADARHVSTSARSLAGSQP